MEVNGRLQPTPETQHLWDQMVALTGERNDLPPGLSDRKIEIRAELGKLSQETRKLMFQKKVPTE